MFDQKQSAEPRSASVTATRRRTDDRRDIQRTINLWQRNVSENNAPPLLDTFDFSPMQGDWGHRFLICSDPAVENAVFVAYGLKFAELLDLPARVTAVVPLNHQIAERYRPLFAERCSNAMHKQLPARFSGAFEHDFTAELFRAVFLPIRLHWSWSKWLIFGSFNCRTVLTTDQQSK